LHQVFDRPRRACDERPGHAKGLPRGVAYERARDLWQRYLTLDPDSDWSRTARKGLALCQHQALPG
jgi:hypothetical protein